MLPWSRAWTEALYGPGGFYARGEAPVAHFRTSVHASGLYAAAIGELLRRVDEALGHPDPLDLVDVGAGRGELLAAVPGPARVRRWAVEVGPVSVPGVTVVRDVAELPRVTGLLVANEWLDDLPVDVVSATPDGPRVVLVDASGAESYGGPPPSALSSWVERWWPSGDRAEVGLARDAAWAAAVGRLERGVAVAVDYGHEKDGRPEGGTLTGYRDGRQVPPVPDGSCDLTAHVAMDAVAAAGVRAGATHTRLDTQRAALLNLGLRTDRPPVSLATDDPRAYVAGLQQAGEAAELTSPAGLGGFLWLVQGVGVRPPFPPAATRGRVRRPPAPPPG